MGLEIKYDFYGKMMQYAIQHWSERTGAKIPSPTGSPVQIFGLPESEDIFAGKIKARKEMKEIHTFMDSFEAASTLLFPIRRIFSMDSQEVYLAGRKNKGLSMHVSELFYQLGIAPTLLKEVYNYNSSINQFAKGFRPVSMSLSGEAVEDVKRELYAPVIPKNPFETHGTQILANILQKDIHFSYVDVDDPRAREIGSFERSPDKNYDVLTY